MSGALTATLVRYLERIAGEDGVRMALELAGETRPLAEVADPGGWSTNDQTVALFDAAGEVTGDPDVGRRIGEEIVPVPTSAAATTAILKSFGSVGEVMRNIGVTASKYTTSIQMDAVDIGDHHAVVSCETLPHYRRHRQFCGYTMGILGQTPRLFGMDVAHVSETQCQADGASHCLYKVEWDPTTSPEYDPQRELEFLRTQLESVSSRFEALQVSASELVSAAGVDEALAAITMQARMAIRSPQFLLAVRTSAGGKLRIHHDGLADAEAHSLSAAILADDPDDKDGSRLIVDVASRDTYFGRLAAIQPEGHKFFKEETRLLGAYAGIAAAALSTAAALDEARMREQQATALLGLARTLADANDRDEVAHLLARAVPEVIDCDEAGVMLWDAATATISPAALWVTGFGAARGLGPVMVGPDASPVLSLMLTDPAPTFVGVADRDPLVRTLMADATTALVVPITSKGVFYGVIVTCVSDASDRMSDQPCVTRPLVGMADQASTALENADLLERMRHQALHDALTGTPNQRLLQDRVESAIAIARRHPERVGVLFLDLDRFKNVNDTLGHPTGDLLLQQVTARLQSVVRESDTVARLGGDEFAILLHRLEDESGACIVAQKLLDVLEQPFTLGENRAYVSGSIGIAVHPDHGTDYKSLLKNADAAMYAAKARGRGVFEVFDSSMQARDHTHLALEADLHMAVERGQLRVLYQPQVEFESMQIVGAEALVRWEHPELGMIAPDQFIPLAEETGLIVKIDAWVLRTACQQAGEWRRSGLGDLRVAVNLSGRDLRDPSLPSRVSRAIADAGIEPWQLELEVTERVVEAAGDLFVVLEQLRALGVRLRSTTSAPATRPSPV